MSRTASIQRSHSPRSLARPAVFTLAMLTAAVLGDNVNYWDYHQAEDRNMDNHCPPFDKAFSAIFDSNATTALSAIVSPAPATEVGSATSVLRIAQPSLRRRSPDT